MHRTVPPTFGQITEGPNSVRFVSPQTGKDIVLELSDECSFVAQFKQESELSVKDVAYDYPNGLVGFDADCGTPGYTTTVTQYYLNVEPSNAIVRKYSSLTNSYFTLNDASIEQTTYDGTPATKVTYQVTDGSNRDMDGAVDGRIKDPAGLAILVDSSNLASTGESTLSLAFIAAILTLAGLITLSPYAKRLRKIS